MALNLIDPKTEYAKDKDLKPEDVRLLMDWVNKQPHLPKINEVQAIIFLQSCYFSNEATKLAIDTFFTVRTLCPELFFNRNPLISPLKENLHTVVNIPLPKKTPEGYTVLFVKLLDPDNFNLALEIKHFDMVCMRTLHQEGTSKGYLVVFDTKVISFGILSKIGIPYCKRFIYYLQEAMPFRLKGLHFFNIVPVMDKILALIRQLSKSDLLALLHLHKTIEDMAKFVPIECLPEDYGGSAPSLLKLQEQNIARLNENTAFFNWEETLLVNEKRRPGKPKNAGDFFGIEGTFKKLEID